MMGDVSASVLRPPTGHRPPSLAATRARRPSWRDPRLAIGVLLVCVSVLIGARVLAASDDTVVVLAARGPLVAGQQIAADDLTAVRLRFASEDDAARYLSADQELATGTVLLRPVGAGELVPRTAVSSGGGGLVELPLAVDPGRVPASVRVGSVVDVWATTGEDGDAGGSLRERRTERLLIEVPVLSVSRASGLGAGGLRQVVVGIRDEDKSAVAQAVAGLDGSLVVLRRPG